MALASCITALIPSTTYAYQAGTNASRPGSGVAVGDYAVANGIKLLLLAVAREQERVPKPLVVRVSPSAGM